jgi:hypothetical protein
MLRGSKGDLITIDGAKTPELVPQWHVWAAAFRYTGTDDVERLPTVVYRVLTAEQRVGLVREASAAASFDRECGMRAVKVGKDLLADKPELVESKLAEATMICRRHTLEVRDKLLAGLPAAGASALTRWVESLKSGMKITLQKSALKAFRLPE